MVNTTSIRRELSYHSARMGALPIEDVTQRESQAEETKSTLTLKTSPESYRGQSTVSRARQKALLQLSPFELKDEMIRLAEGAERENVALFLNAGRGNPNWVCTTAREAFGTLLRFAIEESRRTIDLPDLGRQIAKRAGLASFT